MCDDMGKRRGKIDHVDSIGSELMLTFISGWKSADRNQALVKQRDESRNAIFFIDDYSSDFIDIFPHAPLIDIWRNGRLDLKVGPDHDTIVRVNYDTDHDLIMRAVTHLLLNGADSQIIVTFDAIDSLYRLLPALRAGGALLAANERLEAPAGDRVMFTRGGSFRWHDHILESQTALLMNAEVIDAGIVPDEIDVPYND